MMENLEKFRYLYNSKMNCLCEYILEITCIFIEMLLFMFEKWGEFDFLDKDLY
jgi:hypothetical protein